MGAPSNDCNHAVQFYGDHDSLCASVGGFLAQGFVDRHPAIVIATPAHTTAILKQLEARTIDVDMARKTGDLIVLDAHQTLYRFMDGDTPNARRFENSVGALVADVVTARQDHTLIRAYGEMVDVLWQAGKPEAAIRLEMLWNKLVNRYGLALLCGYAMGNFSNEATLFEEVCRQHTYIMPAELPKVRPISRRRPH